MTNPKTAGEKKAEKVAKAEKAEKDKANAAGKKAVDKARKTVKTPGDFPKIATDSKIQTVVYDATSGVNVKFKDMSFTSSQLERLIAIAQDTGARVRITIEEINPTFNSTSKKKTAKGDPTFKDASPAGKKDEKKTADDGSKLPI